MQKQLGSILLIAGTCIGSGMIALPIVLAKLALIPSFLLMLVIWAVVYYTSLISLELNIQAGHGLSLGALGKYFSGPIAEMIGTVSLKLLSYALLTAYIYGGSSVLQKLLGSDVHINHIEILYTIFIGLVFLLPIKWIDYTNRFLFIGLMVTVAILLAGLTSMVTWSNLPLLPEKTDPSTWSIIIPVVFTSFGFQGSIHTFINYCHKDVKILKSALLWGTLIPVVVYTLWIFSILIVIHHENPLFYAQIIAGKAEVGDLIKELSSIAQWKSVQLLVWWISFLAIFTSLLGVGIGLCDSLKAIFTKKIPNTTFCNIMSSIFAVLPACIAAVLIPNAFIVVLGFAGMILSVIAILLPVYLLYQANFSQLYCQKLKYKPLIVISGLAGIAIAVCEIINMTIR